VEGRFPYLDHEVIEFSATLPPRLKMKVLREKYLLRVATARYLPTEVTARHKQPYRAPDSELFSDKAELLEEFMDSEVVKDYGYFDHTKVRFLINKSLKRQSLRQRDTMALVGVLTTQMLHRKFIAEFHQNFRRRRHGLDVNHYFEGTRDTRHVH
jgi:asparagine synthase (glutamine-hydrolysing)